MCQCIQFSQLIGGTKKIKLFTIIHKKLKKKMFIQLTYVACINGIIKQKVYKRQSLRIAQVTAVIVVV